ncbi:hypothetical protein TTHERM_000340199 (macronuclear) [Tetrahymena thermophila SB210]|uniref:Uncharacterized protein n=1 Tax=Tetrahymena thermophila (strain SB210) TaxID=312017 RepID=W7X9M7_TETTS|nr:hypothetical protein TTHERM_000340199 [Tetrahymena thermophila SB210]EWS74047.1 hypothetical protein TTHERM_000340199 [Tetrahymena thermophila SB210]|eukprot:XP_012653446.1 hypothetical protein TTHERM_000340199 [Tetrahymena thermophila SB210]
MQDKFLVLILILNKQTISIQQKNELYSQNIFNQNLKLFTSNIKLFAYQINLIIFKSNIYFQQRSLFCIVFVNHLPKAFYNLLSALLNFLQGMSENPKAIKNILVFSTIQRSFKKKLLNITHISLSKLAQQLQINEQYTQKQKPQESLLYLEKLKNDITSLLQQKVILNEDFNKLYLNYCFMLAYHYENYKKKEKIAFLWR